MKVLLAIALILSSSSALAGGEAELWIAKKMIDIGYKLGRSERAVILDEGNIPSAWKATLCTRLQALNYEIQFWFRYGETVYKDPYHFVVQFPDDGYFHVPCEEGVGRDFHVYYRKI
jgi:hypothetical protein